MSLFRRRSAPKLPDSLIPVLREYGTPCPNPDGVSPYHRGYLARSKRGISPYASGTHHYELWMMGRLDHLADEENSKPLPLSDRRTV